MTTIAIDLQAQHKSLTSDLAIHSLRRHARECDHRSHRGNDCTLGHIADAIEAAADKRVVVLDVDAIGLDHAHATELRTLAHASVAAEIGDALLRIAGSLTPPRPPEPTGFGAQVRDGKGTVWLRVNGRNGGSVWRIDDPVTVSRHWGDIPGPIEVLSPGVDGGAS